MLDPLRAEKKRFEEGKKHVQQLSRDLLGGEDFEISINNLVWWYQPHGPGPGVLLPHLHAREGNHFMYCDLQFSKIF